MDSLLNAPKSGHIVKSKQIDFSLKYKQVSTDVWAYSLEQIEQEFDGSRRVKFVKEGWVCSEVLNNYLCEWSANGVNVSSVSLDSKARRLLLLPHELVSRFAAHTYEQLISPDTPIGRELNGYMHKNKTAYSWVEYLAEEELEAMGLYCMDYRTMGVYCKDKGLSDPLSPVNLTVEFGPDCISLTDEFYQIKKLAGVLKANKKVDALTKASSASAYIEAIPAVKVRVKAARERIVPIKYRFDKTEFKDFLKASHGDIKLTSSGNLYCSKVEEFSKYSIADAFVEKDVLGVKKFLYPTT